MGGWSNLKARWEAMAAEYGRVAIGTYFSIFGLVLLGFWMAIATGLTSDGALQGGGSLLAAYAATKLTQPLRIAATIGLTPLVARVLRKKAA